ncbi:FAD-dependent monooxygenase [Phreatobacter sp.]|uniref:FAD-dependent monooxygenase n=1 Tax=Phreatobacter sp. TaxID=1966341 RepID=UPI0022BB8C9E|nr:FAD-dependent monooxygenase [Phreatobacter sp.]MCZ8314423.1 FAD-dependent monooxygenase [Phreatobacter sp.]
MPGTVTIAGAGIGGLTAALTLARRGFSVTVLERAVALDEIGAGIQLSPNASRILVDLGLGDALATPAVVPEAMVVRSATTGGTLASAELGEAVARRYGAPWWVIHRADLLAILAAACRSESAIHIETGVTVTGLALASDGVRLDLSRDGERNSATTEALVGADGLRSAVRAALGDGAPPDFRRRVAWRATMPMEAVPQALAGGRLGLWLGADAHCVHYPLRTGRLFNIVVLLKADAPVEGWRAPGDPALLARRLAGWPAALREVVARVDDWQCWSLADRPAWFGPERGPVTLMGDAAHPMLPFVAQGGAMAIEDAAVLADEAATTPDDLAAAFRRFAARRKARVARVQALARRNGAIYHLKGPAALARDLAIRVMGGGIVASQDWIYGWRP